MSVLFLYVSVVPTYSRKGYFYDQITLLSLFKKNHRKGYFYDQITLLSLFKKNHKVTLTSVLAWLLSKPQCRAFVSLTRFPLVPTGQAGDDLGDCNGE